MRLKYRGFTLVEVLISLSIFTLFIGLLLWGFRQGLIRWQQATQRQHVTQAQLLRHDWLQSLLEQTIVTDYIAYKTSFLPYFKGNPSELSWISAAPLLDVRGHVRPVSLKLEKNQEIVNLYYREGDDHSDAGRGLHWSQPWILMMSSLKQARFSYEAPAVPMPSDFEKEDIEAMSAAEKKRYRNAPEWMDDLDSEVLFRMPQRVKFDFVDAQNHSHQWLFSLPSVADVWSLETYRHDD
jgi:prepilin-type N-terminal cleavage/methylation domain-containing protein